MSSKKIIIIVLLALSIAGFTSAAVILKSGEQLDATAYLNDGLVYVTLADGRMLAYDPEEVDLEASGLTPKVAAEKPEKAPATIATLGGQRLDEQSGKKTGDLPGAVITITDADVVHVAPGESPSPAGNTSEAPILVVSRVRKQRSGNLLKITGLVTNSGADTVGAIRISASAFDKEGKGCGQRTAGVSRQLEPGQNAEFTVEMAVKKGFADLKVEARGKKIRPEEGDS